MRPREFTLGILDDTTRAGLRQHTGFFVKLFVFFFSFQVWLKLGRWALETAIQKNDEQTTVSRSRVSYLDDLKKLDECSYRTSLSMLPLVGFGSMAEELLALVDR